MFVKVSALEAGKLLFLYVKFITYASQTGREGEDQGGRYYFCWKMDHSKNGLQQSWMND